MTTVLLACLSEVLRWPFPSSSSDCVCFGLIENLHKINFNWKSCLGQGKKLSEQLSQPLAHSLTCSVAPSFIQSLPNWDQTNIGICLTAKIPDKITNTHVPVHVEKMFVCALGWLPYLFMLPKPWALKIELKPQISFWLTRPAVGN